MMRRREVPSRGTRLVRCARWLGVDRNPLRRGTDRIEAAIRLAIVILLVAAVPIAVIAAGRYADHVALHQARAQQAADHRVTAVLLQQAPATGSPDPYTSVQTAWVLARWQAPGWPARSGQVLAPAGAPKGSTVPTWVNASGAVTDPPAGHRDVATAVCVAVVLTCLGSCLVLLAAGKLARRALDRRRLSAWDAEWRAIGPLWSGHRS
jgi:hypothetical protein